MWFVEYDYAVTGIRPTGCEFYTTEQYRMSDGALVTQGMEIHRACTDESPVVKYTVMGADPKRKVFVLQADTGMVCSCRYRDVRWLLRVREWNLATQVFAEVLCHVFTEKVQTMLFLLLYICTLLACNLWKIQSIGVLTCLWMIFDRAFLSHKIRRDIDR